MKKQDTKSCSPSTHRYKLNLWILWKSEKIDPNSNQLCFYEKHLNIPKAHLDQSGWWVSRAAFESKECFLSNL